jgi:tetratricopeptide (TPR) repeat protein
MNHIILLLRNPKSKLVDQLQNVLGDYFGSQRIEVRSTVPEAVDSHTVIVALLSEGVQEDAPGWPLDDLSQLEQIGLQRAFERELIVLPILLDDAKMPSLERLPASVRKLGLSHALPLRTGSELPRDLGRVVRDLEEHLGFHPDNAYPWDLWLLPLGVLASILCSPFAVLWLLDVWYWNYGYETVNRFLSARWVLETIGPFALGCSLLVWTYALELRRYRLYLFRRTDFFRTGSGKLPRRPNLTLSIAFVLAVSSIGFGAWSAVPAAVLAAASLLPWSWQPRPNKRTIGIVAIVWCLSACSIGWTMWRSRVFDQFELCLEAYERGVNNLEADNLETASKLFDEAIGIIPEYGHAYQGLATVAAKRNDWEAAVDALTRAIEYYPSNSRGVFDPDQEKVAQAYENRAKLRRYLGQDELAEADQEQAGAVDPWLDLFGGLFRVW